ncbi:COX15/CtaA family protein [Novosphingobium lentum]|uniref:COX15/CtaA family protein n=1 Tax=Novosphingobium lentum TaxID=145287 RepID=UPI00082D781A|nr:COX15/CtaA family protein [Novosphingobium lentum]
MDAVAPSASTVSRAAAGRGAAPLALARWLLLVAALVAGIVVVGGITRLTESGVSITEWNVVSGTLPPLSAAQWQAEFDAYRQTPQFQLVNGPAGMTLATYKTIFFWEWVHRLLARAIGTVLIAVTALFWVRGRIPPGYKPRLLALIALVGLQGAIGWWMVKSGIVHDIKVSHLRLAAHLLTALFTLAGLVWTALDLRALARGEARAPLTPFAALVLAMLFVQLLLGAFVAGMRAGTVAGGGWFNWTAWPLMQGAFVPDGIDWRQGMLHAFTGDPLLVHFLHRWWAWAVVAALIVLARKVRRSERSASVAIHVAFGTQVLLGVATVYSGVALPLAVLHQLVGALLVAATTWGAHGQGAQARRTAHPI